MDDVEFQELLARLKRFRNEMLFLGFVVGWSTGIMFATVLHAF